MDPPSTEKTAPRAGDLLIGGTLEVQEIIGDGMTSTVVAAIERKTGRRVAVKIARNTDLESTERFRRAAHGMMKLTSKYAVAVHAVGETSTGQPCMSMEYLEGRTLAAKLLHQGPLPLDESVRWMIHACEAVANGHAKGLLHRDFDAENIFLADPPNGDSGAAQIRVLDFGLSPMWRNTKGDGRLKPGDAAGTSFALPPELARGADVDDRIDIWGAGSCLYRLITNRYPFNARNLAELCTRVLSERPPDLTKMRPQVTTQLSAIVKRCLEREPGDRYPSMLALIDALRDTLDEAPNTPHVTPGSAAFSLDQLRDHGAMTMRDTPRVMKAADSDVASSSDVLSDEDATSMFRRDSAVASSRDPEDETALFDRASFPTTPRTVRTAAPAFDAIADQLEPHQRRSDREDGPSTQPLGRLSPFAELPKRAEPEPPPSSSQEESIVPQLVPHSDAFAPPKLQSQAVRAIPLKAPMLPKPSAAVQAMETAPPPPLEALLPKPSPERSAAETVQREAPKPAPKSAPMMIEPELEPEPEAPQLFFQASPRTLAMPPLEAPPPTPSPPPPPAFVPPPIASAAPNPIYVTGPPAPVAPAYAPTAASPVYPMMSPGASARPPAFTGPPPAYSSGSLPPAMGSSPSNAIFAQEPLTANPPISARLVHAAPTKKKRKSGIVVPLLFATAAAASVVIGLKVAKVTLPIGRSSVVDSGSATAAGTGSGTGDTVAPTPPTVTSVAVAPTPLPVPSDEPAPAEPDAGEASASLDPKTDNKKPGAVTGPAHHHHTATAHPAPPPPAPQPKPKPAPSPQPAATPSAGKNLYDPSQY